MHHNHWDFGLSRLGPPGAFSSNSMSPSIMKFNVSSSQLSTYSLVIPNYAMAINF
jgi:hypothetical protein